MDQTPSLETVARVTYDMLRGTATARLGYLNPFPPSSLSHFDRLQLIAWGFSRKHSLVSGPSWTFSAFFVPETLHRLVLDCRGRECIHDRPLRALVVLLWGGYIVRCGVMLASVCLYCHPSLRDRRNSRWFHSHRNRSRLTKMRSLSQRSLIPKRRILLLRVGRGRYSILIYRRTGSG